MWAKTRKPSEQNIRENLHDFGFDYKVLLDIKLKAQATKGKRDKLDFMKIKNFCASKDTIKKVKRQPTEWEEMFENHVYDKGFISRIHEELL